MRQDSRRMRCSSTNQMPTTRHLNREVSRSECQSCYHSRGFPKGSVHSAATDPTNVRIHLKARPKVDICRELLLASIGGVLKWGRINEIPNDNGNMVDLFLLIVDRDCKEDRRQRLNNIEAEAKEFRSSYGIPIVTFSQKTSGRKSRCES